MIKSFSKFIGNMESPVAIPPVKSAVVVWGEFNPPTRTHGEMLERAEAHAKSIGAHVFIYTTPHRDNKKRPLIYEEKIKFLRRAFPRFGRAIQMDENVRSSQTALNVLRDQGYTKIDFFNLGGSSELNPSDLNEDFVDGFKYHQCLVREEERSLRRYALEEDFGSFLKASPFSTREKSKELYIATRDGLGLNESSSDTFRPKFEKRATEDRESFYESRFSPNDKVRIKSTNEIVTVKSVGCNYVVVEHSNGPKTNLWPSQLTY